MLKIRPTTCKLGCFPNENYPSKNKDTIYITLNGFKFLECV